MKVEKLGEVKSIDQVSEAFTLVTNQKCDPNLLNRDNYVQQSCDRASILVQTNDHKTLERIRLELLINKEDFNSVLVGDNWLIETSSNNASALERDLGGRIYG